MKFGTDGWRAVIAEGFTFANVDRVAQATVEHWKSRRPKGTKKKVVVGCDRRFLADQFAGREIVISRLARGVPAGGELEYMDSNTLNQAFADRRAIH